MASAFDCPGQFSLVFGTGASLASRADFSVFYNESAECIRLFIVDGDIPVGTELAEARLIKKTPRPRAAGFALGLLCFINLIAHSN
jgi:hypothetical protein